MTQSVPSSTCDGDTDELLSSTFLIDEFLVWPFLSAIFGCSFDTIESDRESETEAVRINVEDD